MPARLAALRDDDVDQGVGLIEDVRPAKAVVQAFREEFAEAVGGLLEMLDDGS